jgi:hypothetical protein
MRKRRLGKTEATREVKEEVDEGGVPRHVLTGPFFRDPLIKYKVVCD